MTRRGAAGQVWSRAALRLIVLCAPLVVALAAVTTVRAAGTDYDKQFGRPQYLIHATGHGTTQGGEKDDFYLLYPEQPSGANGSFTEPDGSGGTVGYSSDFHSGPFSTPRAVCQAAQGRGIPADTDWAGTGGGGIGAPVIGLAALAGLGALLGGAVVVQRAGSSSSAGTTLCDEALARWALMVPRRVDMLQRLQQGTRALSQAYAAQRAGAAARAELQSEYTTALLLLGSAGALAAAALLACGAVVGAAASTAGLGALSDFGAMTLAAEAPLGLTATGTSAQLAASAQSFAQAASLMRVGAGIGAGTAANTGAIQQLMSSGMSQFDGALAQQTAMLQQLATSCNALQHDLAELDRSIGDTLATLRGCPNIPQDEIDDPRVPAPSVPTGDTSIQG
ncbi:MAG: hypothetical protein E6J20_19610 [Chloroflexi bacterium]|nr:MAG: hypothetical protein E6J20_19610 [Chloroflexota bacterium]